MNKNLRTFVFVAYASVALAI